MVSPLFVCACPLPVDLLLSVLWATFLCIHGSPEKLGEGGTSNGMGVFPRSNDTSISAFLNGSSSGVNTRSRIISSDSTLVRRLDDAPQNEDVCGVGGSDPEYALDENLVLVSDQVGVESFEELVMTERFSLERERPLVSLRERGMALEILSARVRVDFVLNYGVSC